MPIHDENSGYFTVARDIVQAIVAGEYSNWNVAKSSGAEASNVVGEVMYSGDGQKFALICDFVTACLRDQVPLEECMASPDAYECGVTFVSETVKNPSLCFWFDWPEDRLLDKEKLKVSFEKYFGVFTQKVPAVAWLNPRAEGRLCVGPFAHGMPEWNVFANAFNRMQAYNDVQKGLPPEETLQAVEGNYFAFNIDAYLALFVREDDDVRLCLKRDNSDLTPPGKIEPLNIWGDPPDPKDSI